MGNGQNAIGYIIMIYCIEHKCPHRLECLRYKAAPANGEGRMKFMLSGPRGDNILCESYIPDTRLSEQHCEVNTCNL